MAFDIRCIGRVLSVLGSRLKNEVYTYTFPCVYLQGLFSLHAVCCDKDASGHHHYNKMETLLVRWSTKVSVRQIDMLERGHIVTNEMQFSDGEHNMSDRVQYFPFIKSNKLKLFLSGPKQNYPLAEQSKPAESANLQGVTFINEMQMSDRKLYLSDHPKISLFAK